MKKPEAWTAYNRGEFVYVYNKSEADEHSNALEAALAEAVELLREAKQHVSGWTSTGEDIDVFLKEHGGEGECASD